MLNCLNSTEATVATTTVATTTVATTTYGNNNIWQQQQWQQQHMATTTYGNNNSGNNNSGNNNIWSHLHRMVFMNQSVPIVKIFFRHTHFIQHVRRGQTMFLVPPLLPHGTPQHHRFFEAVVFGHPVHPVVSLLFVHVGTPLLVGARQQKQTAVHVGMQHLFVLVLQHFHVVTKQRKRFGQQFLAVHVFVVLPPLPFHDGPTPVPQHFLGQTSCVMQQGTVGQYFKHFRSLVALHQAIETFVQQRGAPVRGGCPLQMCHHRAPGTLFPPQAKRHHLPAQIMVAGRNVHLFPVLFAGVGHVGPSFDAFGHQTQREIFVATVRLLPTVVRVGHQTHRGTVLKRVHHRPFPRTFVRPIPQHVKHTKHGGDLVMNDGRFRHGHHHRGSIPLLLLLVVLLVLLVLLVLTMFPGQVVNPLGSSTVPSREVDH
jgi:hypothetical protein